MNRVRTAGAVIAVAAVAFTGAACGGDDKNAATTSATGAKSNQGANQNQPADNTIRGLIGVAAPKSAVRVGNFCSDVGAVAQTKDGKAATCTQKQGESKARWAEQPASTSPTVTGAAAGVRVGNFCSDAGAIGQTKDGKPATCVQQPGEKRARWAEAKSGTVAMPGSVHPGAFCAPAGANGKSAKGQAYTCTKKSGEKVARWRK